MKKIIYTEWDGSQPPFSLERKEIVQNFLDNIMKGMSPRMSLSRMFWEGFTLAGMNFRVMGLEEMVQDLQHQIDELYSKYNLEKAFDKPMNDLKSLVSEETKKRLNTGQQGLPHYEDMGSGLLEKLKNLEKVKFQNEDSRESFTYWKDRAGDILDLYEFYSQHSLKFRGEKSLDFDEALELMRKMQALQELQEKILNGQLAEISPEDLKEMLSEEASWSLNILLQLPSLIKDEGMARFKNGKFDMTPKGMRALAELAFGKVFEHIRRDRQGRQRGNAPQTGEIEPDSSHPYEYGDRFDVDITKTVLKAVSRNPGMVKPLKIAPDDLYVRDREQLVTSTTILLLDLSYSMTWEGRFEAAKKVALALHHYIRTRFPKDRLHVIGFSIEAKELKGEELSLVTLNEGQIGTNLQGGLRLAMKLLKKSGSRNNRIIVITDGQPTAYYEGEHLHVELPHGFFGLSPNACKATLREVRKVTAQGMNIDTFMLDDSPVLVEFTREMSRINGGRAVVCVPGDLGKMVFVEEIKRRRGRI